MDEASLALVVSRNKPSKKYHLSRDRLYPQIHVYNYSLVIELWCQSNKSKSNTVITHHFFSHNCPDS